MIFDKTAIQLTLRAAREEKVYYLHQLARQEKGREFEPFEIHDVIALVEIIIPALEAGLAECKFDTRDIPRHRVLLMALSAYIFNHIKTLTAGEYNVLVKIFLGLEDELVKDYEDNVGPEERPEHEQRIIRERKRVIDQIQSWNEKRRAAQ